MEKAIFLIGSGGVDNSWLPIEKAINNFSNKKFSGKDAINLYLAQHVYLTRWSFYNNKKSHTKNLGTLRSIEETIRKELTISQEKNEIRLAADLRFLIKYCFNKYEKSGFVTTNWDETLEQFLKIFYPHQFIDESVIHLHGSIKNQHALYFPTEIVDEVYRAEKEKNYLKQKHFLFNKGISETTYLFLFGISLSALDAELACFVSLMLSTNKNIQKVIIVDHNPEIVEQNLTALIDDEMSFEILKFNNRKNNISKLKL